MYKAVDLKNGSIKKLLNHYLYSSVIGMVIKSVHIVLDGIFLGNKIGAKALAAVNIVLPVFAFFYGCGNDDRCRKLYVDFYKIRRRKT